MKDEFNDNSNLTTKEDIKAENTETNNDANMDTVVVDDTTEDSSNEQIKETKEKENNDAANIEMNTKGNEELVEENHINENEEIKTDVNSESNKLERNEGLEGLENSEEQEEQEEQNRDNRDSASGEMPPICPVCGQSPCICKSKKSGDVNDLKPPSKREIYENEELFEDYISDKYGIKDVKDIDNKLEDLIGENVNRARDIAVKSKGEQLGRYYTDHNDVHLRNVADKTLEVAQAVNKANNAQAFEYSDDDSLIRYSDSFDNRLMYIAAKCHDLGMSNHGYNYKNGVMVKQDCNENNETNDYEAIRKNHPLNSALRVLENRDKFKEELGLSDKEVDIVAATVFGHSKSNSGIRHLNKKEDLNGSFETIKKLVNKYNSDNEKKISFGSEDFDTNDYSKISTNDFNVRHGDIGRCSKSGDISESGEIVNSHLEYVNNNAKSWNDEVADERVCTIGENGEYVKDAFSRKCHLGEQNIVERNFDFDDKSKSFVEEIVLDNGENVPYCTAASIIDQIGESNTSDVGNFKFKFRSRTKCSLEKFKDAIDKELDDFCKAEKEDGRNVDRDRFCFEFLED